MSKPEDTDQTRRDFMKKVGGAAAGVTVGGVGLGQAVTAKIKEEEKTDVQYGMVIDLRRCIGCQACTVACKAEADVPLKVSRSWVEYVEKGQYPNVGRTFLPRLCNHCSNPHCTRVCPTGATYKRPQDGVVVVDQGICIGCLYCAQACPYGARFLNPVTRFADKCDLCIHRISQGLVPSCVNTCQGRARIFGDVNDVNSEIHRLISTYPVQVIRQQMGTEPNIYYIGLDSSDEKTKTKGQYVRVTTNKANREERS